MKCDGEREVQAVYFLSVFHTHPTDSMWLTVFRNRFLGNGEGRNYAKTIVSRMSRWIQEINCHLSPGICAVRRRHDHAKMRLLSGERTKIGVFKLWVMDFQQPSFVNHARLENLLLRA